MKKMFGALLGLVVLVVVGAVGVLALSNGQVGQNPITNVANDAKASATNALIDASGVKDTVQNALESQSEAIAAATGLSVEQVNEAVADLDVENWQATVLPADASEAGTTNGSALGFDGVVTTYDDPGYVTVSAYGQDVTLAVPESAQQYLPLLSLVQ